MSKEISVVAVDIVPSHVLERICAAITETFARPCRVGAALPKPYYAFDAQRRQYSAEAILRRLHVHDAERVLGVVNLDLFVPDLNFVFGLADRANRRALIALPRLRQSFYGKGENEQRFIERSIKEAIHELGHTYGLAHCTNPRCVMSFSNSLADTEYKGRGFCATCRTKLQTQL
jgi:archaemetzincin